ncbi:UNVERIFIED_CONTAM: hypothetical protein Sradi_0967500 [Sesamum radiatum]|uniref:RsdA/BaiN/AoA(So)-like insert domain-containing protein n=1 Tax=Sesamum radiatum TaxID=300843 RepID=A0AAW2V528_SESRA
MNAFPRLVLHNEILSKISTPSRNYAYFLSSNHRRKYYAVTLSLSTKPAEETLVVVGGGAAGMYGGIRAKTVAPDLNVFVIEKGKPLSKGYKLAAQLGHSIVKPVPSLFTFKIDDFQLVELSGVGPMLVTHWGFSGPVILRLSAWGARELSDSDYKGSLVVDFVPDLHIEDVKAFLVQHKNKFAVLNVDGVTGGFNFQNAWSGGYIAGTSIGNLATATYLKEEAV